MAELTMKSSGLGKYISSDLTMKQGGLLSPSTVIHLTGRPFSNELTDGIGCVLRINGDNAVDDADAYNIFLAPANPSRTVTWVNHIDLTNLYNYHMVGKEIENTQIALPSGSAYVGFIGAYTKINWNIVSNTIKLLNFGQYLGGPWVDMIPAALGILRSFDAFLFCISDTTRGWIYPVAIGPQSTIKQYPFDLGD